MSPGFGRFRVFVREWQDRYALCHSRTETRITQSTRGDNYPDTGGYGGFGRRNETAKTTGNHN